MSRIAPRTVAVTLGGVVLSALMAGSASAAAWGTVTSKYDGKNRSSAYGNFYNERNVYATNKVLSKDLAADGNTIYTEGIWYFTGPNYEGQSHRNTPEHSHSYYVTKYMKNPLVGPADKVRATTAACVQLGFPVADRCSAAAIVTVSY